LNFNNDNIAQQQGTSSRGRGIFYDLYGSNHNAGALIAWAWGVSRIIDVLEATPSAQINAARIGVTGCSRNGKGAIFAGAFDERIALTIPQESGSGGDACWRLSKFERDSGSDVQTAEQIVTENPWFSRNFESYNRQLNTMPVDHHLLAAMVAPRGLISFANTDYNWLSPLSSFGCMTAARTVYAALGVQDRHGFVQDAGHSHCSFPSSAQPQLNAFINRFLLDQSATTNIFQTNNRFGNVQWQASNWIDWNTPTLSGSPPTTQPPTTQPPTTQPPTTQPPTTQPPTTQPPTTQPPTTQPPTTQPPTGGAGHWEQCGGIGFNGPTTCQSPWTCTVINDWYYQCL
jgi:cell division septation protein DedD